MDDTGYLTVGVGTAGTGGDAEIRLLGDLYSGNCVNYFFQLFLQNVGGKVVEQQEKLVSAVTNQFIVAAERMACAIR